MTYVVSSWIPNPAPPRFGPLVISLLHMVPWSSPLPAHDRVVEDWEDWAKSIRPIRPLTIHAYRIYRIRFIIAGNLCSARGHLGGFPAQIDAIAVTLHLPAVRNSGVANAYDLLMRKCADQLARRRRSDVDIASLFP